MKKDLLLLLSAIITIVLCFSACTKKPEKLIVGRWTVESAHSITDVHVDEVVEADKGEIWNFKENGTFSGYMNLLDYNDMAGYVECEYVCDGNTIELRNGTLKGENYNVIFLFNIENLTKQELSLSGKVLSSTNHGNDTNTTTIFVSYEFGRK